MSDATELTPRERILQLLVGPLVEKSHEHMLLGGILVNYAVTGLSGRVHTWQLGISPSEEESGDRDGILRRLARCNERCLRDAMRHELQELAQSLEATTPA